MSSFVQDLTNLMFIDKTEAWLIFNILKELDEFKQLNTKTKTSKTDGYRVYLEDHKLDMVKPKLKWVKKETFWGQIKSCSLYFRTK
jgi:hypothetical protein